MTSLVSGEIAAPIVESFLTISFRIISREFPKKILHLNASISVVFFIFEGEFAQQNVITTQRFSNQIWFYPTFSF
jgi:hypothetical protein